jgi:phage-related protein
MYIVFYKRRSSKRSPVYDFIKELEPKDRLRVLASLKNVEELGFDCPRVEFRQIKSKLWEIKINAVSSDYRIFYVTIKQSLLMLLHAYKKQSQKTPLKEITIAEKRMFEVMANEAEALYNT